MDESNAFLKQKFMDIQKKQNDKLINRNKARIDKENSINKREPSMDKKNSFGVKDELDLKMTDIPFPSNQAYSEELVMHLNDQIRDITNEKNRLLKLISENEFEMKQLRKRVDKSPSITAGNDATSTKIVDLSKKVRELTSELSTEKNKVRQHVFTINELQKKNVHENIPDKESKYADNDSSVNLRGDVEGELAATNRSLTEKLKRAESKVAEHRNNLQTVRQELNLANKALIQEVGEGSSAMKLLSESSSWKGRSQQIVTLQRKLQELKAVVADNMKNSSGGDFFSLDDAPQSLHEQQFMKARAQTADIAASASSAAGSALASDFSAFERHKEQIKRLNKDRRETINSMTEELNTTKASLTSLKEKYDSTKARNKVLTSDLKACKLQINTLLEKGKHDDELVQAMIKQQDQMKTYITDSGARLQQAQGERNAIDEERRRQECEHAVLVGRLRTIIDEKEGKIQNLTRKQNMPSLTPRPMTSSGDMSAGKSSKMNQVSMLSLVESHTAAADTTTHHHEDFDESSLYREDSSSSIGSARSAVAAAVSLSPHKRSQADLRSASLSSPVCRGSSTSSASSSRHSQRSPAEQVSLQEDLQKIESLKRELADAMEKCERTSILLNSHSVESNKMTELQKLNDARIRDMEKMVLTSKNEANIFKKKNTSLEKQIGKLSLGKHSTNKNSSSKSNMMADSLDVQNVEFELEEYRVNLEIQQDENSALKAALQRTMLSREEDKKLYGDMLEQTKYVFLHGLRSMKNK